jgi:hypothetical protein
VRSGDFVFVGKKFRIEVEPEFKKVVLGKVRALVV